MGNTHSYEYRDDPVLQAQIEQQRRDLAALSTQIDAAKRESERQGDPAIFREQQRAVFETFLAKLPRMKFMDVLPAALRGKLNVAFIGDVSAGKSSLINRLFGTSLAVGVGHTTNGVMPVAQEGNLVVWDSPGGNRDFAFFDPAALNLLYSASKIVVLFDTSLTTVAEVLRTALTLKGSTNVICVRTQCDKFSARDCRTVAEELKRDRQHLDSLAAHQTKLFATSAVSDFDNNALKAALVA